MYQKIKKKYNKIKEYDCGGDTLYKEIKQKIK